MPVPASPAVPFGTNPNMDYISKEKQDALIAESMWLIQYIAFRKAKITWIRTGRGGSTVQVPSELCDKALDACIESALWSVRRFNPDNSSKWESFLRNNAEKAVDFVLHRYMNSIAMKEFQTYTNVDDESFPTEKRGIRESTKLLDAVLVRRQILDEEDKDSVDRHGEWLSNVIKNAECAIQAVEEMAEENPFPSMGARSFFVKDGIRFECTKFDFKMAIEMVKHVNGICGYEKMDLAQISKKYGIIKKRCSYWIRRVYEYAKEYIDEEVEHTIKARSKPLSRNRPVKNRQNSAK